MANLKKSKIGLQDQFLLNAGQKLLFVIKIFVLSILAALLL